MTDLKVWILAGLIVSRLVGFGVQAGQSGIGVSRSTEPQPGSLWWDQIPAVFRQGTFSINVRARYEYVSQDNLPLDSHAGTVRTRFGFTTAPLYGIQGMLEAENIVALDDDAYNAAGANGEPLRPVVADPETTEINQAWLAWTWTNWFGMKLGRQRIVYDNHRFVGDVGWRQNMQTFDAVSLHSSPGSQIQAQYAYVWDVRRVFGNVSGLPPANRDFESDSHLVNVAWSPGPALRWVGYSYLLDLENAAGPNQSCATYGAAVSGTSALGQRLQVGYRAEVAWQTDFGPSRLDYSVPYHLLELSGTIRPWAIGAGWERLGSDDGVGFRTPLATLHAWNGWADVFLNTPNAGLRDLYGFVQVNLPWEIPLRIVYHKFDADRGGADFGQELDLMVTKRVGKYWSFLAKYAWYDGADAPYAFQVHKVWAQVEFQF
ncbi:MAG: alginate export family protein [Verrucomicrobiota bacterium]|nr:alginate export family protein [Limisphaera sp.]MDW8381944.1 alginate export family protein [Verrucomicrobiota bacterium]